VDRARGFGFCGVYSIDGIFRGWVLKSKWSGKDASSASMDIVQDAGHEGARDFGEFAWTQEVL
jgi:hypothetical protein